MVEDRRGGLDGFELVAPIGHQQKLALPAVEVRRVGEVHQEAPRHRQRVVPDRPRALGRPRLARDPVDVGAQLPCARRAEPPERVGADGRRRPVRVGLLVELALVGEGDVDDVLGEPHAARRGPADVGLAHVELGHLLPALAADERAGEVGARRVEVDEEVSAARPPLVEQVARVGRVDVDALRPLAVVRDARAEAGAEHEHRVGRREGDGDEAQRGAADGAAVARVLPALGVRARVGDQRVVQHLAPRRVLRERAVEVVKDRLVRPAPPHAVRRRVPARPLEARLHRAAVLEVVAGAVRRQRLGKAGDRHHPVAVVVDPRAVGHRQPKPRGRLETQPHGAGDLVGRVDDAPAQQVVDVHLLYPLGVDLAAVPAVDAVVEDDRLAERHELLADAHARVARGARQHVADEERPDELVLAPRAAQLRVGRHRARVDAVGADHLDAALVVVGDDGVDEVEVGHRADRHAVLAVAPRVLPVEGRRLERVGRRDVGARVELGVVAAAVAGAARDAVVAGDARVGEDAQPVAAVGVRLVVGKPQQRHAHRADQVGARRKLGGAAHLGLGEEPEAVVRRAGGDVVRDVVVGVDDPVGGGRLVDGEQRKRGARVGAEVVRDDVLRLDAVLDEEGVAHRLEGDVVDDAQVVDAVDGDGAVVRVVDRVVPRVRVAHVADHVEVERVAPQPEALPHVAALDVLDPPRERLGAGRVHHHVRAVPVELREGARALQHDVAREQADVGAELDRVAAVDAARLSQVAVLQGAAQVERQPVGGDRRDHKRLGLLHRAVGGGRRDHRRRADRPAHALLQRQLVAARLGGGAEVGPRPIVEQRRSVEVERAEAARQHLGAVHGHLLRDGRAVQRDRRSLQKGLLLGADDERSARDEDDVGVQLQVDAVKLERALHDEHVQARRRHVEQQPLPLLDPDRVAFAREVGLEVAAPRRRARPQVNVRERRVGRRRGRADARRHRQLDGSDAGGGVGGAAVGAGGDADGGGRAAVVGERVDGGDDAGDRDGDVGGGQPARQPRDGERQRGAARGGAAARRDGGDGGGRCGGVGELRRGGGGDARVGARRRAQLADAKDGQRAAAAAARRLGEAGVGRRVGGVAQIEAQPSRQHPRRLGRLGRSQHRRGRVQGERRRRRRAGGGGVGGGGDGPVVVAARRRRVEHEHRARRVSPLDLHLVHEPRHVVTSRVERHVERRVASADRQPEGRGVAVGREARAEAAAVGEGRRRARGVVDVAVGVLQRRQCREAIGVGRRDAQAGGVDGGRVGQLADGLLVGLAAPRAEVLDAVEPRRHAGRAVGGDDGGAARRRGGGAREGLVARRARGRVGVEDAAGQARLREGGGAAPHADDGVGVVAHREGLGGADEGGEGRRELGTAVRPREARARRHHHNGANGEGVEPRGELRRALAVGLGVEARGARRVGRVDHRRARAAAEVRRGAVEPRGREEIDAVDAQRADAARRRVERRRRRLEVQVRAAGVVEGVNVAQRVGASAAAAVVGVECRRHRHAHRARVVGRPGELLGGGGRREGERERRRVGERGGREEGAAAGGGRGGARDARHRVEPHRHRAALDARPGREVGGKQRGEVGRRVGARQPGGVRCHVPLDVAAAQRVGGRREARL